MSAGVAAAGLNRLPRPVRAEFLEALYATTEGNPFFIEEVLKALVASGEIFYADGIWDRKPLHELHIPRTNRDIGDQLVVSERTVEKHVENILAKLAFSSRAQIAAWAVEKALIARAQDA